MDFPEDEKRKWIEWELNSKTFLEGKKLSRKKYPSSESHTHCEFCWDKFGNGKEDRKIGYYERETKCWICEDCYEVFKDYYHWVIE